MIKKFYLASVLMLCCLATQAQEIKYSISISTPKLQTADPKVFENLKSSLESFLNGQQWTEDIFENEERIDCKIQLTITEELSPTTFNAELAIQASRPVYGSNYQTPLLNYVDKDIQFEYEAFQPLAYTKNTFNNNLVAIFSFYSYLILGLDYDSFSPFGGEQQLQTANEIVNSIPPAAATRYKGWRSLDGNRNRFWIIDNILSPRLRNQRQAWYDYHRQGLDIAVTDVTRSRNVLSDALVKLDNINVASSNLMILQMFVNAKWEEIIEVFKAGNADQKKRVYEIMTRLDTANANRYQAIGL